ncbi:hypothetical protein CBR_g48507 [Chara braunii]|uniref:Integrase zinc-binding domain-containing protein n=1 Tax=Chara braunii TaxID=69332 RepID=A0A388M313_CHABU|nr:hypothetical protein CBR_g48507 [Chara braunii]|eukprot:GBG88895.1 hypothetical protein CBR_g48507 [Chara braunii]
MFNFELERIPGDKNRANGLSSVNWDGATQESIEDTPPVDGFLDQEEDVRLHINEWSLRVPSCVTHPILLAPRGYERKEELVLKPFQEEDPWGSRDVGWMMRLALAGAHSLAEEVRTIEEGPTQVEEHEQLMGGMHLITNTLLQGNFNQTDSFGPEESELLVPQSQDDEFEEGEIREAFRAEEYDGIYRELGLLLSCEIRDRDASAKAQKMRHVYAVRDGHPFIKRQVGNPKRIVCGRNRQIDVIAALHDGIAGGHRGVSATCAKISELYHWDGMLTMVIKYCQSCVPCQQRSAQRPGEPLHPRLEREVGAVVHLDLLFMPLGEDGSNYIFDARDNLTGSDFSKAVMQRGRRDTRPRQGPQRAAGRGEQHEPPRREPTPEFDDDNIELFLDVYRDHAAQRGWSVAERIHHLRGIGRFEEPVAQICEEALTWPDVEAGMQRLRASPRGRDDMPIRLEEGNAEEFIPAYEHDMEPQDPEMAAEQQGPVRPQVEEVITVGDDTPPCSPAPEPARPLWPGGVPEPDSEEIPELPPEATAMPEQEAEMEGQRAYERARVEVLPDLPSATHVTESPVIEEPAPAELPQALPCTSERMGTEASTPEGQGPRVRRASRETREEKSARVRVRLDEIHARQAEMEAVGIEPMPPVDPKTSEQRIDELWGSQTRRAGADGQGRGMQASPSQGAAVEAPRQAGPVGEVPLDTAGEEGGAQESLMAMSMERRGSRLHELAAAMGIGTPQERPQRLDTPEYAPRLGELRTELGSWATETDSGGPDSGRQQQQEVMSEPTAMAGSQPSGSCGDEMVVVTERPHEEEPRELDTPDYRPVRTAVREGGGAEAMEPGPQGHMGVPSCHEVTTETMGTPSASSSQGRNKKTARWHDTSCFWCKKERHRVVDCPELLEDKAEGRVAEFNGKFYDRQGRIVERAPDGGRA